MEDRLSVLAFSRGLESDEPQVALLNFFEFFQKERFRPVMDDDPCLAVWVLTCRATNLVTFGPWRWQGGNPFRCPTMDWRSETIFFPRIRQSISRGGLFQGVLRVVACAGSMRDGNIVRCRMRISSIYTCTPSIRCWMQRAGWTSWWKKRTS